MFQRPEIFTVLWLQPCSKLHRLTDDA